MELPTKMVNARDHLPKIPERCAIHAFDLSTRDNSPTEPRRAPKTSVAGSWGGITGDRYRRPFRHSRAAIEGTQIPMELIRRYATRGKMQLTYDPRRKHGPLVLKRTVEYFGFELESEVETVEDFPSDLAKEARHALAEALARGEARHFAVKQNRETIDEIREAYKRSGGETKRLGLPELIALYEEQLAGVSSMDDFRQPDLRWTYNFVPLNIRERARALADQVTIRDREVEIDYDVEDRDGERRGVVRLVSRKDRPYTH